MLWTLRTNLRGKSKIRLDFKVKPGATKLKPIGKTKPSEMWEAQAT